MPRVLYLIPSLEGGGAERQLSYLAEGLQRFGLTIHVGYLRNGPHLQRLHDAGVATHYLGPLGNSDPRLLWRINRVIQQVRPQLIQTWLTQMDILGALAATWNRIPFIICERTSSEFYANGWKNYIRVALGRRAAAIAANSNGGIEYWRAQSLRNSQICCVIPNAIPFDEIGSARPVDTYDVFPFPFKELILFAGRMISIKNVSTLVSALLEILKRRPDAVAVLLGDGPLAPSCDLQAQDAGLASRLKILPFSDRVYSWMKRADVFVSVSEFEGNPNAVLEAAACGCPLVLSDIPAHREVFGDRAARFVLGRSSESIAAGILDVLNDRATAQLHAKQVRRAVEGRTSESCARQYVQLYEAVLQSTRI